MNRTSLRKSGILGCILLISAVACKADSISINLTPPLVSGSPGSAVAFSGTLSNTTSSTVFLNSAGINLSGGFAPSDEDTSPFFVNAPLFLVGSASTSPIGLFTINIPSGFLSGQYLGSFTVLGGASGDAQDVLGSANFTAKVGNTGAVPEPSSASLLLIGAFCMLIVCRKATCGA